MIGRIFEWATVFKFWIRNTGLNIAVMLGAEKSVQGFINGLGCGVHTQDCLLGGVAALQRGVGGGGCRSRFLGRKYEKRSSLVIRASDCQCTSCNGPGFDTVPTFVGTVESDEGRQMKQPPRGSGCPAKGG
jgi:hypothetical protein